MPLNGIEPTGTSTKTIAMRPVNLIPLLLLAACGQGGGEGSATTPAVPDAAFYATGEQLRDSALAFFHALPARVDHPAGPDGPEKVELGRRLFMEPQLSTDGTISCNSCHRLDAFGTDNERTSTGVGGQKGGRNSPTVYNAALHNMQFWDGRAADVEQQAGMPILNPIEMAMPDEATLVSRLKGMEPYPALFKAAFPEAADPITYANLREAIGAFERTLLTPSRFDDFLEGNMTALSAQERSGLRLFMAVGCTNCHSGAAIGGSMLQKFGVHADFRPLTGSDTTDQGRKAVTGKAADKDVFKVPGLRNVTSTAPYFHDGRVERIEDAIKVMGTTQLGRALADGEVADLKAFLEALTGTPPPKVELPSGGG